MRLRVVALLPPEPKPPLSWRRLTGPCGGVSERLITIDGADRIAAWLRLAPVEPWLMPPPIEPWPPASDCVQLAITIAAMIQVFRERNMAVSFARVGPGGGC
jgi:hypothetical protein